MKFKSIQIKNFRNFETLAVEIGNKNVFFGMNDIGKTNSLYALRILFDRDIRKRDLIDSDFYKRNVLTNIEIIVGIDITDTDSIDTKKLRAKLKGAIGSNDNKIYIKLEAKYNNQSKFAEISMYWGSNADKLSEMKSCNGFFDIDSIFNVIYINSYVDLNDLFKKNIRNLIRNNEGEEDTDNTTEENIKSKVVEINREIAKLSGVQSFENKLTPSYKKMRDENVSISIKSDFAINYLYSNIVPYIHQDGDSNEYPTSGEGRKKLLAFSVYNILSEDTAEKKINLFLIEEPETHLHRSMQSALSHFLFDAEANDNMLNYLFITTHSQFILSEMDDVNLVRLYNADKISAASEMYTVPTGWKTSKKKLNRTLSEAIFADSVLLVEGESECILFERVLSETDPYYESKGIYILSVEGVGFKPYIDVLSALDIKLSIRTDNDAFKVPHSQPAIFRLNGFSRVNGLVMHILPENHESYLLPINDLTKKPKPPTQRKYYKNSKAVLDNLRRDCHIFLSHCDLEEDLCECLGKIRFTTLLEKNTAAEALKFLKSKKQHIMVGLVGKFTKADCKKIYDHYNFACLKVVRDDIV